MRTFLTVLKNDYLRTLSRLVPTLIMTLVTLGSILLAVYMTGVQQVKGHVVVIPPSGQTLSIRSSKALDIKVMQKKPPRADLVEQKYDAYVTIGKDGRVDIETLHTADFKNMVLYLLKNPNADIQPSKTERGVGVNIIGFMMMFLLMISFSNLFTFADDKEQGQLRRIAASPASFGGYLAAHCVYCLSLLLPEFALVALLKACGWKIGFTLLQYAGLMAVLGLLGIAFALLLNTLIKKPDNANMLGNSITVLTSVLAGGFYSMSQNNALLDRVIGLLPQKQVMNFALALQNGEAFGQAGSVVYSLAFALVLLIVSCGILRQMYVKKV